MNCPRCASPVVELRLPGELVLQSCSTCEGRFWTRNGERAALNDVLSTVASTAVRRTPVSV
jgi:hypothetical protein